MPGSQRITRRQLLHLLLAVPALAACSSPPSPTPRRTFFEAPTPNPAASATPSGPETTATAAAAPRVSSSPLPQTPTSGQPSLSPALPTDAGQQASARVFPAVAVRPSSLATRRPAPTALIIPTIDLDARIVSIGTKLDASGNLVWETATHAVGHHQGAANPAEPGNVILSGHISSLSEGDVFTNLPKVQLGEGIILRTSERDHLYAIDSIQTVLPSDVHVLEPTSEMRAILITCVPDRIYTHRLIVSALYVSA